MLNLPCDIKERRQLSGPSPAGSAININVIVSSWQNRKGWGPTPLNSRVLGMLQPIFTPNREHVQRFFLKKPAGVPPLGTGLENELLSIKKLWNYI